MSDLLELAMHAHGGLERWRQVSRLDVRYTMTGQLFDLKGFPEGMPDMMMRFKPLEPAMSVSPYGGRGRVGHLRGNRVWITDGLGEIIEERPNPRASFRDHNAMTKWDILQRLYFTGYGMWNYLSTPFLFTRPGFALTELEPHEENGEVWRRLHVVFPSDIPTHSTEQVFYFSDKGLLQRLDYTPEVAAAGAAAHYCFDHTWFGGLLFPTLRRVVQQSAHGPIPSRPTAVLVRVTDVVVT